jgi:hypothetical protein
MMCLSLSQPWAWAIVHGPRKLENRMEPGVAQVAGTLVGKDVAIHANRLWREYAKSRLQDAGIVVPMRVALPASAIVGVATVRGVALAGELEHVLDGDELGEARRWASGRCILFENVRALRKPVPIAQRGGSWGGFWPLPYPDEVKVLKQLEEAA